MELQRSKLYTIMLEIDTSIVKILVLFDLDITVLLALSFYQILVSDHLPASSESVPVVGQSASVAPT